MKHEAEMQITNMYAAPRRSFYRARPKLLAKAGRRREYTKIKNQLWRTIRPLFVIFFFLFTIHHLPFTHTPLAYAASVEVRPAVIDLTGHARDIFEESVEVENTASRKIMLYPSVVNVAEYEGEQEFQDPSLADMKTSLAHWISIGRGVVELAPGELRTIDFKIEVNLRAEPGRYHARIAFPEGATRADAERDLEHAPSVIVNLEVKEDIKEHLNLFGFGAVRNVFLGKRVGFRYELKNGGNRPERPQGEIRLYDRTGKEVAVFPANPEGKELSVEGQASVIAAFEGRLAPGKYKAFLDLSYGAESKKALQDTAFFWYIPKFAAAALGGSPLLVLLGAVVLHRRYERKHYARHAGGDPGSGSASALHIQKRDSRYIHDIVDLREPGKKHRP